MSTTIVHVLANGRKVHLEVLWVGLEAMRDEKAGKYVVLRNKK
jgi:hypothetical protein